MLQNFPKRSEMCFNWMKNNSNGPLFIYFIHLKQHFLNGVGRSGCRRVHWLNTVVHNSPLVNNCARLVPINQHDSGSSFWQSCHQEDEQRRNEDSWDGSPTTFTWEIQIIALARQWPDISHARSSTMNGIEKSDWCWRIPVEPPG